MNMLLGFGIGWILYGAVNLIFSSKKLSRKLDKDLSEYEIDRECLRNRISGAVYMLFGIAFIITFLCMTYNGGQQQ